jgi:hypothetical protein
VTLIRFPSKRSIEIPLYHFLHKDSSAALEKLSKEMTEMKNSGALDKLIESRTVAVLTKTGIIAVLKKT